MTSRLLLIALTLGGCAHATPRPAASSSLNGFAAQLHGALGPAYRGNLFYSPASVAVALAMTRAGAAGDTAIALDRVLGSAAGTEARRLMERVLAPDAGGPELRLANRLYADRSHPLRPAFVDTTRTQYGAPIEPVDFEHDAAGASQQINHWVDEMTRGRIPSIVSPEALRQAGLVLVNAIYLKARWLEPFRKEDTRPRPFHVAGGGDAEVPTMHTELEGVLGEVAGARVLRLPYRGGSGGAQLSMLVVMPTDRNALAALERSYVRRGIDPFVAALTEHGDIDVTLPALKLENSLELVAALKRLGLETLFSEKANFSGIFVEGPTHISDVLHRAWGQVDEEGTEAAAATAVIVAAPTATEVEAERKRYEFHVDRSFLFFIREEATGAVLFAGRVLDPRR